MILDDIKLYLPKYLSPESEEELYQSLKGFPHNINERFYTNTLKDELTIFQGDNISNLPLINLPDPTFGKGNCLILSNTCDISFENKRFFNPQILYAPIFKLEKYKNLLLQKSSKTKDQIQNHIEAIKKQFVTQIFYLPKNGDKINDSIIFLDRILNVSLSYLKDFKPSQDRLFTLSDYGFYMLAIKISIHFSRIQENIERNKEI